MGKKKGRKSASDRKALAKRNVLEAEANTKGEKWKDLSVDRGMMKWLRLLISNPLHRNITVIILLLSFIILLYFNSLGNEFTNWDDQMIYGNPVIRSLSLQNLVHFFTLKKASTYQPIRTLSYAVDYRFWGLNPVGYRLTNVFFYLLTCVAIFFTSRLLLENILTSSASSSDRMAFFTAFVFAAHPVHVEAVTWLAARKEVLQGFFFFLSFYLYMRAGEIEDQKKKWVVYGWVFLTFLLSVLSKPSAVVLPALFLLYEATRKGGEFGQFMKRHWPFILPSLGVSLLFFLVLLKAMSEAEGIKPFYGASLGSNLVIVVYLILYNIKLLAFTKAYSAAYTITASFSVLSKWTLMVFATTLFLFIVVFWSKKKTNLFFFSFFWFLITLLPFLNLVPISILLADRYVFIASFGYCLVVGFLLNRIYEARKGMGSSILFKAFALILFLMLIVSYSWMTFYQNRVWRDSFSLWADAVKKYPWSNLGNAMMGTVFLKRGENEEAVKYLERAIRVRPTDAISRSALGTAYARLNQLAEATKELLEAIRLMPDEDLPKLQLSAVYFRQKEYQKSEEILKELLARNPESENLRLRLGDVYRATGRFQDAISQMKEVLRLYPQSFDANEALGNLYLSSALGNSKEAIYYYTEAIGKARKPSPKVDELRWVIQDLER